MTLTLKINRVRAVVKVHGKYHQAKCSGSCAFVFIDSDIDVEPCSSRHHRCASAADAAAADDDDDEGCSAAAAAGGRAECDPLTSHHYEAL